MGGNLDLRESIFRFFGPSSNNKGALHSAGRWILHHRSGLIAPQTRQFLKMVRKWFKIDRKCSKMVQKWSKNVQKSCKMLQNAPKNAPKCSKNAPKWLKMHKYFPQYWEPAQYRPQPKKKDEIFETKLIFWPKLASIWPNFHIWIDFEKSKNFNFFMIFRLFSTF